MKKKAEGTMSDYGITKSLETEIRGQIDQDLKEIAHNTKTEVAMEELLSDKPLAYEKALNTVQFGVAIAVAHGMPYKLIAKEFNISEGTITNWKNNVPSFKEKIRQIQVSQGLTSLGKRFESIAERASEIMEELMEDTEVSASVRLQAAINFIEQVRGKPKQPIENKGSLLQAMMSRLTEDSEKEAINKFLKEEQEPKLPDEPN